MQWKVDELGTTHTAGQSAQVISWQALWGEGVSTEHIIYQVPMVKRAAGMAFVRGTCKRRVLE